MRACVCVQLKKRQPQNPSQCYLKFKHETSCLGDRAKKSLSSAQGQRDLAPRKEENRNN